MDNLILFHALKVYISKRFVFLELPKTGSTHIASVLHEHLDGEYSFRKHNQASPELVDSGKIFLGSIRNPYSWYVSLWAFGCDRKGYHFLNSTMKKSLRGLGWRKNPLRAASKFLEQSSRHPNKWLKTYTNANDVSAFREWLHLMHNQDYIPDLKEPHYGNNAISKVSGLMTFHFLRLFCTRTTELEQLVSLDSWAKIFEYERMKSFTKEYIKTESIHFDIIRILNQHDPNLPAAPLLGITSKPATNTSSHRAVISQYYDIDSMNLVASRERLILDKFGYTMPSD